MAVTPLPRAEPRVLGRQTTVEKTTESTTSKVISNPTIAKLSPSKSLQKVTHQSMNRRALRPQKLFKPFVTKPRGTHSRTKRKGERNSIDNQREKPSVQKNSPQKNARRISQTSNSSALPHYCCYPLIPKQVWKTSSQKRPPAKRLDSKVTPNEESPEQRRLTRTRISSLVQNFEISFFISQISEGTVDNPMTVCNVEFPQIKEPKTKTVSFGEDPTDVICTEVRLETALELLYFKDTT